MNFWKESYNQATDMLEVLKDVFKRIELSQGITIPSNHKQYLSKELINAGYNLHYLKPALEWLLAGRWYPSKRQPLLSDFWTIHEKDISSTAEWVSKKQFEATVLRLNARIVNAKSELKAEVCDEIRKEVISECSKNGTFEEQREFLREHIRLLQDLSFEKELNSNFRKQIDLFIHSLQANFNNESCKLIQEFFPPYFDEKLYKASVSFAKLQQKALREQTTEPKTFENKSNLKEIMLGVQEQIANSNPFFEKTDKYTNVQILT